MLTLRSKGFVMAVRLNHLGNHDKEKHLDVLRISSGFVFVFVFKPFPSMMVEFVETELCARVPMAVSPSVPP